MNIEDYIIARVNYLMRVRDAQIVKRLERGMSNYTYVVESQGNKYTYRVPGIYAEKFVDREDEQAVIQQVEELGLNNETVYLELRSGEKLAVYVEGTGYRCRIIQRDVGKSTEEIARQQPEVQGLQCFRTFGGL